MNMLALMYVGIGGAIGSMLRYSAVSLVGHYNNTTFPFGTFAVNILGGLFMGILIGVLANMVPAKAKDLHLLLAVGVLGGFTTFSAFTMETYMLLERGLMAQAAIYILGSVVLSVSAFLAGMWCIRIAFH